MVQRRARVRILKGASSSGGGGISLAGGSRDRCSWERVSWGLGVWCRFLVACASFVRVVLVVLVLVPFLVLVLVFVVTYSFKLKNKKRGKSAKQVKIRKNYLRSSCPESQPKGREAIPILGCGRCPSNLSPSCMWWCASPGLCHSALN